MDDGFEATAGGCVLEYQRAHRVAVETAVGGDDPVAELGADRLDRGAAGAAEFVRDTVGIDDVDAEGRKASLDGRLAAADTAGDADEEGALARSGGCLLRHRRSLAAPAGAVRPGPQIP